VSAGSNAISPKGGLHNPTNLLILFIASYLVSEKHGIHVPIIPISLTYFWGSSTTV